MNDRIKSILFGGAGRPKQSMGSDTLLGVFEQGTSVQMAAIEATPRSATKKPFDKSAELEKYMSLDERFQICTEADLVRNSYSIVTKKLLKDLQQNISAKAALWNYERGDLDDQLRYVYIKPHNKTGFLIEETTSGWLICYADKISAQSKFVRKGMPFEIAHYCQELDGKMSPRVLSLSLFGGDYVPMSLYEEKLKIVFLDAISA